MAHRFSSSTPYSSVNYGTIKSTNLFNSQTSTFSMRSKETHVSIVEPIHSDESIHDQPKKIKSALKPTDDVIPIDDFSNGYQYESHLGRSCTNVIVVSARHPHSFFLQTLDDLTYCDNFFSKMNEFYNRYVDAQRLVISKAALRIHLCCVARDEKEADVWNRAQLLEYHPEVDQCSLLLVDLGTWQECVPHANLRHILVPFRNECVRSVPCRLAGIAPAKPEKNGLWNEYAIKTFRNVIDNVPIEIEVLDRSENGSYFVNLFATHETFVCVNDFLLYHKIAIPVDDCRTLRPEELDPVTHEPILAIIYEFHLQGQLLAEELKANQLKEKEELQRKYDEEEQRQSNCRLPCIRIIDVPSSNKNLIFARYNHWIMIPWFSISALFDPPLSENTIERFALLYKFSPISITPLTNGVLCANLEKVMVGIAYHRSNSTGEHQRKFALYSIDCMRKLLLNHYVNNEWIFSRLDEARAAEMRDDEDFWTLPSSLAQKRSNIFQSTNDRSF